MAQEKEINEILQFYSSPALHRLQSLCSRDTFMGICGKRTSETAHSAFLKWLFENNEFSRVPLSPIITFLRLYSLKSFGRDTDPSSRTLVNKFRTGEIKSVREVIGKTEVPTTEKRFVDLELIITLNDGSKLRCCVENKIYSKEHDNQCEVYYQFYHSKNDIPTIYIFLSPEETNVTENPHYVNISYKELYDCVLVPLFDNFGEHHSSRAMSYLQEYIETLTSFDEDYKPIVMSNEYKNLLKEIYDNHREMFFQAISEYGTEDEKKFVKKKSYSICYGGGNVISAIGYTKMARTVIETLLENGVSEKDILDTIGKVDVARFDQSVVDDVTTMGSASRYQKQPIGSTTLYLNNQWNDAKAKAVITKVKAAFPAISIK